MAYAENSDFSLNSLNSAGELRISPPLANRCFVSYYQILGHLASLQHSVASVKTSHLLNYNVVVTLRELITFLFEAWKVVNRATLAKFFEAKLDSNTSNRLQQKTLESLSLEIQTC